MYSIISREEKLIKNVLKAYKIILLLYISHSEDIFLIFTSFVHFLLKYVSD